MSAFASNPFALLDETEDVKPQATKPQAAAAPAASAPAPAAAKSSSRGGNQQRGQRGPKVANGDREINANVPVSGDLKEDRAKSFGGRGGSRGGRGGRGGANPRSNAGTYLGGDRPRREKGPGGARAFDRQSQTGHKDSDKAEAQGWGAEEGKQELEAEVLGEADAQADGAATPAAAGTQTPARVEEEEDNTQTYEEYLAAQAEKKLKLAALPEARTANDGDDQFKGTKLVKKDEQAYDEFLGETKEKKQANKERKAKQLLEVSFSSKPTPGSEAPTRGGRGGRGGPRGGRGGRGEGRGGARGGRAQGPRNNGNNKSSAPAVNLADNTAFPSL